MYEIFAFSSEVVLLSTFRHEPVMCVNFFNYKVFMYPLTVYNFFVYVQPIMASKDDPV